MLLSHIDDERFTYMYRVVMPGGTTRQSNAVRWGLVVSYGLFALAGLLLGVSPVMTASYGPWSNVMAGFIFLGGVQSGMGAFTRKWVGEFTGIPLLSTGLVVLSLIALESTYNDGAFWVAFGNFLLMNAVAALTLVRWRIVLAVYRAAHAAREREGERE